jgi:GNAT superfamily N-acetyltransferase
MPELEAESGEDLDDGYREDTPLGDNLLMDFVRAEADAFEAMATANGGRILHDPDLGVHAVDSATASAFGNIATILRPVGLTASVVADRLRRFYSEGAGGPFLVFSAWPTPPPKSLGMAPVGHPPLMVRVPGPAVPPGPGGVEIGEVTGADELAELEATLYDAYPDPEMVGAPPGALFAPSALDTAWRFYLARVDGRSVATAASWRSEGVTTVEMVSCRPEARGRGIGAAITAAAATDGTQQPAALIASDLGQGVYRSLGFVPVLRYTLWLGHRSAGQ